MQDVKLPGLEELAEDLEYCTVHYFCHLLHALEIIGYKNPNKEIADKAKEAGSQFGFLLFFKIF